MRTALLITGYLVMTTIGAVALGTLLYLVRDELSARRTRRYYRDRETGRSTPHASEREAEREVEGGARVGRPPRSQQYREWFQTTDELAANLTTVGVILLEQERAR